MRIVLAALVALLGSFAPAYAESADEVAAKQRYLTAERELQAQRYDDALADYAEAYRLAQYPALLHRMALCHDKLGHAAEAVALYKRFLAADPTSERRATVETRIRELSPSPPPPPAPSPALTAEAPPRPVRRWLAPSLVLGGAVVFAAVATGLYVSARQDYDTLVQTCNPCQPSQWAGTETRADASYALFAIAGAVAAADVVLWALAARHPHARRLGAVQLGPAGAAVRF